jgi:hypothetical protein
VYLRTAIVLFVSGVACGGSTQSQQPAEHPSAAQQEALAQQDEAAAKEHLAAADNPSRPTKCKKDPKTGQWWSCWSPTSAANRAEAEEHLRMAQAHRAASQALRDAEAKACDGVSDEDRDISPFSHVEDIQHIELLGTSAHPDGARVVFNKMPGLSRAMLQKIIDCHVARADAMGHNVPEESYCPLVPPNVKAVVTEAPSGFIVDVTTDDAKAAKEVVRRAFDLKVSNYQAKR